MIEKRSSPAVLFFPEGTFIVEIFTEIKFALHRPKDSFCYLFMYLQYFTR